jgi:hypothetical protein
VVSVTVKIKTAELRKLFADPSGQVARGMYRLGKQVEARSLRNLRQARRIDTGRLWSSVTTTLVIRGGVPVARVGTNLAYGLYVHEGTGIYGPRRRPITPKNGKFLVFTTKKTVSGLRSKKTGKVKFGGGKIVFAKSVKGMKPTPFLRDALQVLNEL